MVNLTCSDNNRWKNAAGEFKKSRQIPRLRARHKNLLWFCAVLEKLSQDVIDREVCKRLKQMSDQLEYDLPDDIVQQIRSGMKDVQVELIGDSILPFYRHFQFMLKRRKKLNRSMKK